MSSVNRPILNRFNSLIRLEVILAAKCNTRRLRQSPDAFVYLNRELQQLFLYWFRWLWRIRRYFTRRCGVQQVSLAPSLTTNKHRAWSGESVVRLRRLLLRVYEKAGLDPIV